MLLTIEKVAVLKAIDIFAETPDHVLASVARIVEELNLSEIAETLAVSVPRVHQLKAQALEKLRAALAGVADII